MIHIRILEPSASLPTTAILKLYNLHFTDECLPLGGQEDMAEDIGHAWSLDLEVASVHIRGSITSGEGLEDNFPEHLWSDADPVLWEEKLCQLSRGRFESELEVYSHCKALQENVEKSRDPV